MAFEQLEDRSLLSVSAAPSTFGHITNGQFDVIDGHQEWSDLTPSVFPETRSYLYADQANLNHPPGSPPDTFMLMYDEVGMTTPLGANQSFTVSFTTVENEDGHDRLEFYSDQIFTDGTIIFRENGEVQMDEDGNSRVVEIGGQRGRVGFGPSPNSSTPHVIVEFEIALSANQAVVNGGYSPDPQFWSSDPPQPPPPPPPLKLSFYVEGHNTFDTGHAFVQLLSNIGPNAGDKSFVFGKYPNGWNTFDSPGVIVANGDHPWDWRITFPVTQEQYNSVTSFVSHEVLNPSDYDLLSTNCTEWVQQIANLVGIQLPTLLNNLGIPDPVALNQSLASIGDGGTFGGGTVTRNTEHTLPNGAPDPPAPFPDQGSFVGFVDSALQDPSGFAQNLNLSFHQETLSSVGVGLGESLTVSLSNVDLANAITVFDFGDGTTLTQSVNVSHTYLSSGNQAARAIVINGGAVDEFFFEVDVGGGLSANSISVIVPDSPPNLPFPGRPTPPLPAPLPPPPPTAILPGFESHILPRNDDGSTSAVPLGFTINFFGTNYSSLYVNNNGNVTFDSPLSEFTPFDLTSTQHVVIAPFFADVDTRAGNTVTYGTGTVDGHAAFGVTWPGVGYYSSHTSKLNTFQVVLIDRSDVGVGDFDVDLNYGQIQWETGDLSGGSNGLGGSSARAGFSNGTGAPGTFFELPGSAVNGAFLDSNSQTGLIHNSANSPQPGRYQFAIRGGAPELHTTAAFLQANPDGTTTVEQTRVLIGQEPSILEQLVRIVSFRVTAGLTPNPTTLTMDLIDGLVEIGMIPPQQAGPLLENVLDRLDIANLPPALDPLFDQSVNEGSPLSFAAHATDPDPGQVLTFSLDVAPNGAAIDPNSGLFTWTPPEGPGSFAVTVRVSDNGAPALSTTRSFTINVNNVAPAIVAFQAGASSADKARERMPITASGSFMDAGVLDTHTAIINWGDGTSSPAAISENGGAGTFMATHIYSAGGIFNVTVVLSDDDSGQATTVDTVFITGAGLHNIGGKVVLQVVGTNQADNVIIDEPGSGKINVYAAFLTDLAHRRSFDRAGIDYVEVALCDGDDTATVSGWVTVPSIVDGGAGNDNLTGGRGGIVLIGGTGNDRLTGSTERSILIGSAGRDWLTGRADDDLLIGDRTIFDSGLDENKLANDAALIRLLQEWKSADSAVARKSRIEAGVEGYFLRPGLSVFDDEEKDTLLGSSGIDWFWLLGEDDVLDRHEGSDLLTTATTAARFSAAPVRARPVARSAFVR